MRSFHRRALLQLFGAAGALIGAPRVAQAATDGAEFPSLEKRRDGSVRLTLDMAVLGHTDAPNTAGRIGDPRSHDFFALDVRGDSYYCEGLLYPGGTIPAPTKPTPLAPFIKSPPKLNNEVTWDFKAAQSTGHWLNRGWVLINGRREPYVDTKGTVVDSARTAPHLLSEHTFVLGRLTPATLAPETLVTSGVENGNDPDAETIVRAVTGGTGRFAHVSGQVVQTRVGRNTTALRSFAGAGEVLSPNYRFEFELKLR